MKPMLIDRVSSYHSTQSCEKLRYEGQLYEHWCIAKPYSQRFGFKTRFRHALLVLMGKAVAVQYFKDLSDEEKLEELLLADIIKNMT